jgi:hypothetical protein
MVDKDYYSNEVFEVDGKKLTREEFEKFSKKVEVSKKIKKETKRKHKLPLFYRIKKKLRKFFGKLFRTKNFDIYLTNLIRYNAYQNVEYKILEEKSKSDFKNLKNRAEICQEILISLTELRNSYTHDINTYEYKEEREYESKLEKKIQKNKKEDKWGMKDMFNMGFK